MKIDGKESGRKEIEKRVGNISRLGGATHYQYSEGRTNGVSGVVSGTGTGKLKKGCYTRLNITALITID